jgi:hypothetical protein
MAEASQAQGRDQLAEFHCATVSGGHCTRSAHHTWQLVVCEITLVVCD